MRLCWIISGLLAAAFAAAAAVSSEDSFYRLETIAVPPEITLEVGGMAFMPDGRLMICTRYGEVWAWKRGQWRQFASGLCEPLGLCPTGSNQIVVAQKMELTRITDVDGDGRGDRFETLADQWNYSGHPYEWTFGPVQDSAGNLWCTLACWFYPTRVISPNPYSGWEIDPPAGYHSAGDAAWRGWSFKVTPKNEFIPWSSGLRSPNGLGFNLAGDLFVTDNQGEYFGACVLHHITRGAFHGHPNSLFWGSPRAADPFDIPLRTLDRIRKLPAVVFPYGPMGQSASQPLCDSTAGKFGPFAGQFFVGDQTKSILMRVALEKIGDEYQGACFPFRRGFQCGINRLAFASDGSLYVGETDRGWGSVAAVRQGLQRVVWTGREPFEIDSIHLTHSGFDLALTEPPERAAAEDPAHYAVRSFGYFYHRAYGSPQIDSQDRPVLSARLLPDGRTVHLELAPLKPRRIYQIDARNVASAGGQPLLHPTAYYTLNRLVP